MVLHTLKEKRKYSKNCITYLAKELKYYRTFPAHSWLTSTQRQSHMAINKLSEPSIWQTRAKLIYDHKVYIMLVLTSF